MLLQRCRYQITHVDIVEQTVFASDMRNERDGEEDTENIGHGFHALEVWIEHDRNHTEHEDQTECLVPVVETREDITKSCKHF